MHLPALIFSAANYGCGISHNAVFEVDQNDCMFYSLNESLSLLYKRNFFNSLSNATVLYVGDSLGVQYYLSAVCRIDNSILDGKVNNNNNNNQKQESGIHDSDYEIARIQNIIIERMQLRTEVSFLTYFPCHPLCLKDNQYRLSNSQRICKKCSDGVFRANNTDVTDEYHWIHKLDPNVKVLILNSGSWYNYASGMSPVYVYEIYAQMLSDMKPFLEQYILQGTKVIWIMLPPFQQNQFLDPNANYETYEQKNRIVRDVLSDTGVIFLDINELIASRMKADPSVLAEPGHYCSPHESSIPDLLNRVIFHLLAS